ncbi:MAG TPA: CoA-acylating methylmalonate-semialdehyde dehydrogenase [Ginsengibacter sp.]|nr:CoA-acylating methylmalonate-semialdehyde dehydrogenase [Chitinophagaceae bacterium]MCZ2396725.1 CoA-acylating methylmalonate-semialdehyde dehydrogenase [Chitinophagales bacterium]HRN71921.1 CoA-acylating methylmalonate-semialdehyde dehydrogenase [Ginsengibacter sp.]HRP17457.1 CoA-acylating methylmalonate-semialdehyde dehydrogenase [Ginsengibacter sp.]
MNILKNYINGEWVDSVSGEVLDVINPATMEVLAKVPTGDKTATDVEHAVACAHEAYLAWKDLPVLKRIQPLFKLKYLLEQHTDELAATITMESGKTLAESKGEIQRAIENVEVASAAPMLLQSEFLENVATGIDEYMIRQALGVTACIAPFNFPAMISFWFLPYAIACGNSMVVKPSEKVPLTMMKIFELIDQLDIPKGLLNMVHGGKGSVDAILDHPDIKSVSFVGSTPVARYVYSRAAASGKRVQAQGGAKNPVVVLPDADIEMTSQIISDSVYGCAGQRCLAASVVITVDDNKKIREALYESSKARSVGYGLNQGVEMGPVITRESKLRIEGLIAQGEKEGGSVLLDGRSATIKGYEQGNFIRPTIIENLPLEGELLKTEIFGPVMSLLHMKTVEDAIAYINRGKFGNMACLFTSSGASARKFRNQAMAGNVGINIGVAAPMAQFPFSGWKDSFFGDLHGQSRHAIEFFTQTKVVIERWPKEWTRKF